MVKNKPWNCPKLVFWPYSSIWMGFLICINILISQCHHFLVYNCKYTMLQGHCFDFRLHPFDLESKIHASAQSNQKWLRYIQYKHLLRWLEILQCCSAAVLQGLCFVCRLNPFHLNNHHAKFQLIPLRNGWDIANTNICCGRGAGGGGGGCWVIIMPSLRPQLELRFGLAWAWQ